MTGYPKAVIRFCNVAFGKGVISDALVTKDIADIVFRFIGISGLTGLAWIIQGHIPGVRNLYPWAFPLIMTNVGLSFLLFWAAVKLVIEKGTRFVRLEILANEAVQQYNRGLNMPDDEVESYIETYVGWKQTTSNELTKLGATGYAERFSTIGADYKTFIRRTGDGSRKDQIANYANIFYSQHQRLRNWIDSGQLTT